MKGSDFCYSTIVADILTPASVRIYPSRIGTPLPSDGAFIAKPPVRGFKWAIPALVFSIVLIGVCVFDVIILEVGAIIGVADILTGMDTEILAAPERDSFADTAVATSAVTGLVAVTLLDCMFTTAALRNPHDTCYDFFDDNIKYNY